MTCCLRLAGGWSDQRRTAHRKAVKEGAAEESTGCYRINFWDLSNAGEPFPEIGEALAKATRSRVAQARDDEELEFTRVSRTRKVEDLAEWRRISPNFLSNPELPGADLLNLQGLVLRFFRDRAIKEREALRGLDPRVGEVTKGFMRQAQQIRPLWDCMRDRIVAAQEGAGLSVLARGKVHNAAWKPIMSPFFQEHIMGMVREDMAALPVLATFEGGCAAAK